MVPKDKISLCLSDAGEILLLELQEKKEKEQFKA